MRVAFIGLGNMGRPMSRNLIKAGHEVAGYDLFPEAVAALKQDGGRAATSALDAAKGAEVVISMLPTSDHVRDLYTGKGELLDHLPAGTLLMDSSTISISVTRELAEETKKRGCSMIDGPVSGGVMGAEAGTLTFMVGGEAADLERARPLLAAMGKNIVHAGSNGAGQTAKICNNMMSG
ncbi:MAG TPA: NAD(P)-dependent oxidoreductase, partial [Verrucomicrobiae bacterium]|nr:NAD(P)-dependent oxidoreductase [Verrucomicrobiae bacterium]